MYNRFCKWLNQKFNREVVDQIDYEEINLPHYDPFLQVNEPGTYKELTAEERSEKEKQKQIVRDNLIINRTDNRYTAHIFDDHVGTFVYHHIPEDKTATFFTANVAKAWQRCGIATAVCIRMKSDLQAEGYTLVDARGQIQSPAGKAFLEFCRKNHMK